MEKIIHQIWIGEYELPKKELEWSEEIRKQHPDFNYILTNNDNFPKLEGEYLKIKDKNFESKNWIIIADMIRYILVQKFGGIYLDCDYELLKPIYELNLDSYNGFIVLPFDGDLTICNSSFGFNKNNPIINYIVEKIPDNAHWLGPTFFGINIREYFGLNEYVEDEILKEKLENEKIKVFSNEFFRGNYLRHHKTFRWNSINRTKLEKDKKFNKL